MESELELEEIFMTHHEHRQVYRRAGLQINFFLDMDLALSLVPVIYISFSDICGSALDKSHTEPVVQDKEAEESLCGIFRRT